LHTSSELNECRLDAAAPELLDLEQEVEMSKPKEIVQQLVDAHRRADVMRIREILSPKFVWHQGGAAKPMDRGDWVAGVESGQRAFSDLSITIDETITEGPKVAVLLTIEARHSGPFMSIPPTNRTIRFASMWMLHVVDERIVEVWMLDEDIAAKLRT